jgi:hypothetical protein
MFAAGQASRARPSPLASRLHRSGVPVSADEALGALRRQGRRSCEARHWRDPQRRPIDCADRVVAFIAYFLRTRNSAGLRTSSSERRHHASMLLRNGQACPRRGEAEVPLRKTRCFAVGFCIITKKYRRLSVRGFLHSAFCCKRDDARAWVGARDGRCEFVCSEAPDCIFVVRFSVLCHAIQ